MSSEPTGGLGTLGLDLKIFLAQLLNFLIVFWVLKRFAFGPIVKMLDRRQERVAKSMKDAEHVERRLAAIDEERRAIVKEARAEAGKVMEMARLDAEAIKTDLTEKAKREVERVVVQGRAQLKTEREVMLREARQDMAEIAVQAARKIIGAELDEKKSQSLAEEVVRKMT
jgi:F-type H+-transporting ATPase subunit b